MFKTGNWMEWMEQWSQSEVEVTPMCTISSISLIRPVFPSWPGSLFQSREPWTPSWPFAKEIQSTSSWYLLKCRIQNEQIQKETFQHSYVSSIKLIFLYFISSALPFQVKKEETGTIHVIKQRQLHVSCDIISLCVSCAAPSGSPDSARRVSVSTCVVF